MLFCALRDNREAEKLPSRFGPAHTRGPPWERHTEGTLVDTPASRGTRDTPTRPWSMSHAHGVSMLGKDAHATQLVVAFVISSVLPAFGTG